MLMHQPSPPAMPRPVRAARAAMWLGLSAVAVAAAVISFTALRDLGRLSAFGDGDWLLPVVIDAGAAVGSLVWLGRWAPKPARRFARGLAVTLLTASVAGNAAAHGMAAEHITPHWTVVVAVSALAPAVLGAVVHLVVLVTDRDGPNTAIVGSPRSPLPGRASPPLVPAGPDTPPPGGDLPGFPRPRLVADLVASQKTAEAPPVQTSSTPAVDLPGDVEITGDGAVEERAREIIQAGGGRRKLMEELGLSEHRARTMAARHASTSTRPATSRPRARGTAK